ncbi:MAG: metal-sensitive transcriptional regulator [Chloroflexi bacterium]|jgi:DNA-binding FrmR family transcriptional regulator|nr:metal-sensitive transcriptional regulator [Chloroflexota bacterium]
MEQDPKADLVKRLKRIEGQTRGVQKMVEDGRDCAEILHQLSAINEAVRSVSVMLAEQYAHECLGATGTRGKSRQAIAAMIDAIARVPR